MSPPKTGTTSIRLALEMLGAEPFIWNFKEEVGLKHICHMPKELEGYYIFASVRHPYSRQISRFIENWPRPTPPSQEDLRKYTFGPKTNPKLSCSGWLNLMKGYEPPEGCVRFEINHVIKLEKIQEDFNSMPFVIDKNLDLPRVNSCKFKKHEIYLDEEMKHHVRNVMKDDFNNFGYGHHL